MVSHALTYLCGPRQESTLLDHQALESELGVGPLQQLALHAVGSGEAEDKNRLVLAQAVAAVHGLEGKGGREQGEKGGEDMKMER
jgi:hypothetical protein